MIDKRNLFLVIIFLTLISTWYIYSNVIYPNVNRRITFAESILSGDVEAPYQYRILKPILAKGIEFAISPIFLSDRKQHVVSHTTIALVCFLFMYSLFYAYLRKFFSQKTSLIGIMLLQIVVPLSVTGYFMIGDFLNVLFYIIGLNLIVYQKDKYLPTLMAIATANRVQIIFLIVFYIAYLISQRRLRRGIPIILFSSVAFLIVFLGTRLYFGFKPNSYTIASHIIMNTDSRRLLDILALWTAELGVLSLCSIIGYRRSDIFFKLSLLSLLLYTTLFFLKGSITELAKFLPAFLVLIPMSLQVITGEIAVVRYHASNNAHSFATLFFWRMRAWLGFNTRPR